MAKCTSTTVLTLSTSRVLLYSTGGNYFAKTPQLDQLGRNQHDVIIIL
jgi:hypothetical protein